MSGQPYQYTEHSAAPAPPSAGRALWISGIVVGVLGLVLAIVSAVLLFSGVVSAFGDELTAPVMEAQQTNVLSLERGSYVVFEEADTAVIAPQDIRVLGPDGLSLTVTGTSADEQFNRAGLVFVSVAQFDVPTAGVHTIEVTQTEFGTRILVAHGLTNEVAGKARWGFGIVGGGLVFIAGIALFAAGLSRRRRSRVEPALVGGYLGYQGYQGNPGNPGYQPAAYGGPAGPPPGWYPDPDPSRVGGQRYWDGSAWTGHVT